ncbi:hypothetical protein [Pseudomonas sp. LP23]
MNIDFAKLKALAAAAAKLQAPTHSGQTLGALAKPRWTLSTMAARR